MQMRDPHLGPISFSWFSCIYLEKVSQNNELAPPPTTATRSYLWTIRKPISFMLLYLAESMDAANPEKDVINQGNYTSSSIFPQPYSSISHIITVTRAVSEKNTTSVYSL